MTLKTRVKVSHVTNLHDARFCAGMGVEIIGVPIDPQKEGFLSKEVFGEITGWLSGLKYAGEVEQIEQLELHHYQVDFMETSNLSIIEELTRFNLPIILHLEFDKLSADELEKTLSLYNGVVSLFVLESQQSWQKHTAFLSNLSEKYKILLDFKMEASSVVELLEAVKPEGLSLKPGKELKVGVNDFDELADVLEALDTDEFA